MKKIARGIVCVGLLGILLTQAGCGLFGLAAAAAPFLLLDAKPTTDQLKVEAPEPDLTGPDGAGVNEDVDYIALRNV